MKLSVRRRTVATVASNLFLVAAFLLMLFEPGIGGPPLIDPALEQGYSQAAVDEMRRVMTEYHERLETAMGRNTTIIVFFLIAHVWLGMAHRRKVSSLIYQLWWSLFALLSIQMERWLTDLPPYTLLLDGAIVATICLILKRLVILYRNRKQDSPKIESSAV